MVSHPEAHPDPDDLALAALGEPLEPRTQQHVSTCPECAAQISSFRRTVELAELNDFGRDAPPPGDHVWGAIAGELGFAGSGEPAADPEPAAVTPLPSGARSTRRRWRWVAPVAAAVVGIAAGAGAVVLVQNRQNAVVVDATAPLTPVPGGPLPATDGQLGTAELVTARSGLQVRVDASGLPASSASAYEVWLFGDDGRMVSLGTLSDGTGSFTLPQGIDPAEYRTVDISDELPDGNPAHSGISLVRGTFA